MTGGLVQSYSDSPLRPPTQAGPAHEASSSQAPQQQLTGTAEAARPAQAPPTSAVANVSSAKNDSISNNPYTPASAPVGHAYSGASGHASIAINGALPNAAAPQIPGQPYDPVGQGLSNHFSTPPKADTGLPPPPPRSGSRPSTPSRATSSVSGKYVADPSISGSNADMYGHAIPVQQQSQPAYGGYDAQQAYGQQAAYGQPQAYGQAQAYGQVQATGGANLISPAGYAQNPLATGHTSSGGRDTPGTAGYGGTGGGGLSAVDGFNEVLGGDKTATEYAKEVYSSASKTASKYAGAAGETLNGLGKNLSGWWAGDK
ncbi:hypothetical protein PYCC9005_002776 [Savitreella phatthalungensis]